MNKHLREYIREVKEDFPDIPEARKSDLRSIARFIRQKKEEGHFGELVFICTHNSRRSQLAHIWAETFARVYGISEARFYSAGTQETECNPRTIAAIQRAGFKVTNPGGENPHYEIRYVEDSDPIICFSKEFNHPENPEHNFAAIMVCSDADENCPIIPGAEKRFSLPYRDPKESDGTPKEKQTYDERCKQIAVEMAFMISCV